MVNTTQRNADRPYDVIVWGATGFTGALVAEYLAKSAPQDVKFAIAGRNKEKLASVTERMSKVAPNRKNIPVIIANIDDQASLDRMVSQARVVISTAGPFMQHGHELVEACVNNKTDYIDSTGEPPFVRAIIDKHHEKAAADGTMIVPGCGFDSIPSDMGAFMLADHLAKKGKKTASVKMTVDDMKGIASGGTVASLLGVLTETPYKDQWKMMDPYYLCPADAKRGPDSAVPPVFHYSRDFGKWQSYFVMEMTNTRIVRRSNALFGNAYGPNFAYSETQGQSNLLTASAVTVAGGAIASALVLPPVQWAAKWAANKFVPAGSGPTKEQIETGYFKCRAIGEAVKEPNEQTAVKAVAHINGIQDPGYGETSKMLAESALTLALVDRKTLASPASAGAFAGKITGGVLTASTAMGYSLINRLRAAGMTFDVADL
ncbi:saccharopine dehydrogenase [Powellomyces hirtus]|nr:saccharopine dehydrogenase [Powellomyces hirtus]